MSFDDDADITKIRCAIYGINSLIALYRIDFENRIEALEQIADEHFKN